MPTTVSKKSGVPARARPKAAGTASRRARRNSTLSRWGNSLGLRIPLEAADRLNLKAGAQVSIEVRGDSMTIRPVRPRKKWAESELLKGVTPQIVGGAIDRGGPVGKEAW